MKKTTIIWIVILVSLVSGWYYLVNYTQLLSKGTIYYGYYDDVRGMQEAAPVYLKGVKVGKVEEIDLSIRQKVKVIFNLDKKLRLPLGTKAIITTGDVSGTKSVRLVMGSETTLIAPEGILATGFDSTMSENFHAKITPVINSGKILLRSSDSVLNSFNLLIRQGWGDETRKSFSNINKKFSNAAIASGKGNQMVQRFQNTVNSWDSAAKNPQERNANMNKSLASAEKQTKATSQKPFRQDVAELRSSINKFSASINRLQQNKMISDSQTYLNMTRSFDTLNRSVQNYMKDPPPLIKIGGGSKKN